jgi:putative oxidoreductase
MKAILAFLFGGVKLHTFGAELGLLAARVAAGLTMALAHGMGKVPVQQGFIDGVAAMGFPLPFLFAWAAALSELVGGFMLAAGFMTRPVSLALSATMVVAVFIRHGADPFTKKELGLLYLALFLVFLFKGAGRVSVDGLISKRAG